ncbi:alpha-ketoacid dehydrogenase subunit beta, partial [Pseudomonas aeruginosa]
VDEANPRCSRALVTAVMGTGRAISALPAPRGRVTAPQMPVPCSDALEDLYIPEAARIGVTVRQVLEGRDAAGAGSIH